MRIRNQLFRLRQSINNSRRDPEWQQIGRTVKPSLVSIGTIGGFLVAGAGITEIYDQYSQHKSRERIFNADANKIACVALQPNGDQAFIIPSQEPKAAFDFWKRNRFNIEQQETRPLGQKPVITGNVGDVLCVLTSRKGTKDHTTVFDNPLFKPGERVPEFNLSPFIRKGQ